MWLDSRCSPLPGTCLRSRLFEQPIDRAPGHTKLAGNGGRSQALAGQLHDYMFRKLVNWSRERGQDPANPDTSALMEPIAHSLTKDQIEAVAAYLSYLE